MRLNDLRGTLIINKFIRMDDEAFSSATAWMAIIGLLGIDIVKVMLALGKHVWNCCWACNAMYHYKILKNKNKKTHLRLLHHITLFKI